MKATFKSYRSKPLVNMTDDMTHIELDMTNHEFRKLKQVLKEAALCHDKTAFLYTSKREAKADLEFLNEFVSGLDKAKLPPSRPDPLKRCPECKNWILRRNDKSCSIDYDRHTYTSLTMPKKPEVCKDFKAIHALINTAEVKA